MQAEGLNENLKLKKLAPNTWFSGGAAAPVGALNAKALVGPAI